MEEMERYAEETNKVRKTVRDLFSTQQWGQILSIGASFTNGSFKTRMLQSWIGIAPKFQSDKRPTSLGYSLYEETWSALAAIDGRMCLSKLKRIKTHVRNLQKLKSLVDSGRSIFEDTIELEKV